MILSPRCSNRALAANGVRRVARLRPALPDSAAERVGGRAAGQERGTVRGRAVAVDALDLDGRADFAVKLGVAVHVLNEVAIDAVHALLQVDVKLMNGQTVARGTARSNGLLLFCGGVFVRYRSLISDGIAIAAMSWPPWCRCVTCSPAVVEQLACRSFLKTARKTQPWPWKSANCVCLACGFSSATRSRNARVGPVARGRPPRRGSTSATG